MLAPISDQLCVSFHSKLFGKLQSLKNNGNSKSGSKFPPEPVCSSASAEKDKWAAAKSLASPSSVSPTVSQSFDSAWGSDSCWFPASILRAALLPAKWQHAGTQNRRPCPGVSPAQNGRAVGMDRNWAVLVLRVVAAVFWRKPRVLLKLAWGCGVMC